MSTRERASDELARSGHSVDRVIEGLEGLDHRKSDSPSSVHAILEGWVPTSESTSVLVHSLQAFRYNSQ